MLNHCQRFKHRVPRAVQRAERHDTGSRTSRNVGARPGERLADAAEIRFIGEFGARQTLLVEPVRSYVICCVQRTGSWLLAHTLADTGYGGWPSDYFDDAERENHTREWGLPPGDLAAYIHALWDKATTPNGVLGSKLMWNNFDWLRSSLRSPAGTDPGLEFMRTTFPNAQFIWLRRRWPVHPGRIVPGRGVIWHVCGAGTAGLCAVRREGRPRSPIVRRGSGCGSCAREPDVNAPA